MNLYRTVVGLRRGDGVLFGRRGDDVLFGHRGDGVLLGHRGDGVPGCLNAGMTGFVQRR